MKKYRFDKKERTQALSNKVPKSKTFHINVLSNEDMCTNMPAHLTFITELLNQV